MSYTASLSSRLLVASALAAFPSAALPWEAPVELGILTCTVGPRDGAPTGAAESVGEQRPIACRFRAGPGAPDEAYVGTLQMVGRIAQTVEPGSVLLIAKAPMSRRMDVGSIQQKYVAGAKAEGSSQPPPLVGERDNSVVLYPLAPGSGQPSLALGQPVVLIVSLELRLESAPA